MATVDEMVAGYFKASVDALAALYKAGLYGHVLLVVYATIDTVGLLDAPPGQVSSTGASFKHWVSTYLLPGCVPEVTEADMWAARCSVLHTFSSESDLSRAGKARELVYYSGDKSKPEHVAFVEMARSQGRIAVHFTDLCDAFVAALTRYVPVLIARCAHDSSYACRLEKVLQVHATPNLS